MSSDIKLEETFVVVEGNALKVSGWDIMLDGGPDRRGGASGDTRRALVHDKGDKLTVNYANDYSGGVLINDKVEIKKNVPSALGPVLTLTNPAGVIGAGAAIDFNGYDVGSNPPTARIQSFGDGNFSSYISFYTKQPGKIGNQLNEILRINNNGDLCISGNIIVNKVLGSKVPTMLPAAALLKTIDLWKMLDDLSSCQQTISKLENEVDNLKKEVAILKNR